MVQGNINRCGRFPGFQSNQRHIGLFFLKEFFRTVIDTREFITQFLAGFLDMFLAFVAENDFADLFAGSESRKICAEMRRRFTDDERYFCFVCHESVFSL